MRRVLFATLALFLAPLASDAAPPVPVDFYPDWFPGPQFAGVTVALGDGLFAAEGLDVTIHPFAFGGGAPEKIASGTERCAIGSSEGYILVQKRAGGLPLVALGTMFQDSPAGFMSLDETVIETPADLAGRRIGLHAYAEPTVKWILAHGGVAASEVTLVPVKDDLDGLLRGEVDVHQGFATTEFVDLQRRANGRPVHFASFSHLGLPAYAQVLYTSADSRARHATTLAAFLRALQAGWLRVFADPEATVILLRAETPDLDPDFARASLAALRDYVMPGGAAPLAPMDLDRWKRLEAALAEMGKVTKIEAPATFIDQSLLPAQSRAPIPATPRQR